MIGAAALAGAAVACTHSNAAEASDKNYADLVNPLMGTMSTFELSTGNTYPAIARPWGMNFWTPQTSPNGDGWAYQYTDNKIQGFKQTHQPSPWINDYGQFSIMPVVGKPAFHEDERQSWYSHKSEDARPYYYKAYLSDWDVVTEITPTERAAMFRFTFPQNDSSFVVIDAFEKGSYIKVLPEQQKVIGYTTRNSGGVPDNFRNYFVMEFSKPFTYSATFSAGATRGSGEKPNSSAYTLTKDEIQNFDGKLPKSAYTLSQTDLEKEGWHTGAVVGFPTTKSEQVIVRVASSFISFDQAELNLKELDSKDFDALVAEGQEAWNDMLGRIEVEGGNLDQDRTFYSCLYRALLFPRKFYEIDKDGQVVHYSPYNGQVLPGYMYTDTGLWDTFRSLFPLLNLAYPSINQEIQEGMINAYKESGFFPEWASPGHRDCMVGNNSASVLADAYLKGIQVADTAALWAGIVNGTNNVHPKVRSTGRLGHEYYNELGYVPYDVNINESGARTLEYAYDDWCIYQLAKALNRPEAEQQLYAQRAMNYKNIFDKEYNLMRGRNQDGNFQAPFSPYKWGDAFTEGNPWHYTWSVFHDPKGLMELMGGREQFVEMLDSVFVVPPIYDDSYYGFPIHEITEMAVMNMGNYAHGNQPIQHMIYLYDWAGEPWKAQYWTRETMDRLYTPTPDGYCGDEDNGQTSAWYVFSALGFYPVAPGTDEYALGAPLFKKAKIHLENGKTVTIDAPNNSADNRYIEKMTVNGKTYDKNYITYPMLMDGANITFDMGAQPNKERGTSEEALPYSFSDEINSQK